MFDRLIGLVGKEGLEKIEKANIAIVGIGGVGGFALEGLIRSGIKNITIFDGDIIDLSNLNRQIITTQNNIGKSKVDEAIKRCNLINSNVKIVGYKENISNNNINKIKDFDYVIDACDDINAKVTLIKHCNNLNIPIVCALGTGKRLGPEGITISRLDKTQNDALARSLRNKLRKENISLKIPVIYNCSDAINNDKNISSCIFSPGVAGLFLAYYVIDYIINKK